MKKLTLIFISLIVISGCAKDNSEMELQKEILRKEAAQLKARIDSTQKKIDSSKIDLDSLGNKINIEIKSIDSMNKIIESKKKEKIN